MACSMDACMIMIQSSTHVYEALLLLYTVLPGRGRQALTHQEQYDYTTNFNCFGPRGIIFVRKSAIYELDYRYPPRHGRRLFHLHPSCRGMRVGRSSASHEWRWKTRQDVLDGPMSRSDFRGFHSRFRRFGKFSGHPPASWGSPFSDPRPECHIHSVQQHNNNSYTRVAWSIYSL